MKSNKLYLVGPNSPLLTTWTEEHFQTHMHFVNAKSLTAFHSKLVLLGVAHIFARPPVEHPEFPIWPYIC